MCTYSPTVVRYGTDVANLNGTSETENLWKAAMFWKFCKNDKDETVLKPSKIVELT